MTSQRKSRRSTSAQTLKPSPKPPALRRSVLVVAPMYFRYSRSKREGPRTSTVFFFASTVISTWVKSSTSSKKFCTMSRATVSRLHRTL